MDGWRIRKSWSDQGQTELQPLVPAEDQGIAPEALDPGASPAPAPEPMAVGVVLVNSGALVLSMNWVARCLLDGRGELRLEAERIRASSPRDDQQLRALIGEASQGAIRGEQRPGGALCLHRADGRAPLEVLVAALRAEQAGSAVAGTAVIYLIEPAFTPNLRRPPFAPVRGLTAAEGRVAALIADGHNCREAAQLLGLSHHTVRTQLKHIFTKTGVRRQSGLVRFMMGLESSTDHPD
ncbi:MAG TPA: helix-turn-helix transcriptional regulator [Steroidobacteraceae bacterium]|nr:helix-turn-helix transcriptional regulator [Steroidobacteraceae bacterium]